MYEMLIFQKEFNYLIWTQIKDHKFEAERPMK